MDEVAELRERIAALERDNAALERECERLRNPARRLWSKRGQVWNQIERTLHLGTWTWDVATQAVEWSPNLFALLGYDPEVTPMADAARVFDEAIHPDDLPSYLAGQERALSGDTSQPTRFRFVRPDGRTLHLMLLYTAIEGEDGEPASFAGAILDVTDRVQAEGNQLRAGRLEAVGRLAGSVAHDFNNLLTVMMGHVDLLLRETPGHEGLETIRDSIRAAASLTYQLLSFTKPPDGVTLPYALDDLVSGSTPLLKLLLREDIQVELELGAAGALVAVNRGHFQNALVNLAVNARDAMPMGGRLSLRTAAGHFPQADRGEPPRPAAVLRVEDVGVGMDEETLSRVFEPFFTTKDGSQGPTGTGLGLVSVQRFVRGAGGELEVRSSLGSGTTFELFFPLAESPSEARGDGSASADAFDLTGDEILIVEDAADVRRVLIAGLEHAGLATPHSFPGPEQALASWPELQDRVRVLITDVVMPGRSGRELATLLRRDRPDLGVVFVTGYDPEGTPLERAVLLGKPYTIPQLLGALRAVTPASAGRA